MNRRDERDSMSAYKSPQDSEYATPIVSNFLSSNPDEAFLSVLDRFLHSITEVPEDTCSELDISDSGREVRVNPSIVIAEIKELMNEIENSKVPSDEPSRYCGKNYISTNNASNSKGSISRHRSSDLRTKNSKTNTNVNTKSNTKCLTHDPIRSICLTPKVKSSSNCNIKSCDGSDAAKNATNPPNTIDSISTKSSHVPLTSPLISKQSRSVEREDSKRKNSSDGTYSVFINSLPSFRSQKPKKSWSSSESNISSDYTNFYTGNSNRSNESTRNLAGSIASSSNSKKSKERPKSTMNFNDIKNGVSTNSLKSIKTVDEPRKSTPKPSYIGSYLSSPSRKSFSKASDIDEPSIDGLSDKSQKKSRAQTESSIGKLRLSSSALKVLKKSSAFQEDSPNDFQYLATETGCGGYKSSLSPHQKIDGIPSQTHKNVLFSARKMHRRDAGRGEPKIIKQEWATTRINTFDDSSKTFEVMDPRQFSEIDSSDVDRTKTIFAVLPNRTTVCYVPDRIRRKS